MDLIRRFLSFVNRPDECGDVREKSNILIVPCHYLGNTYVDQPNTDELRRAVSILTTKAKKDLDKNLVPLLSICFEESMVVLKDGNNHTCREYEIRRIVVCCVDAKNQKHLAIFYHSYSPYIATKSTNKSQGLECHLFICRNKDIAKTAANKIGELLSKEYQIPTRPSVKNLEADNVRMSKANYEDFDYENVSKFFQQKVFNVGISDSPSQSAMSSPYSSVSTFATTTGCDSGCASTIASVDIRAEYIGGGGGFHEPAIEEHDESSGGSRDRNSVIQCNERNLSANIHNRYSVHYDDQEEEQTCTHSSNDCEAGDNDNDSVFKIDGMETPELKRLLDMSETNI